MSTKWPGSVFIAESDLGFMRLFRVVLGKLWSMGQIWPSAYVLWIKFQWNTVMAVCLRIVCGCFWATTSALSSHVKRSDGLQSLKYLLYGPLQKKCTNPSLQVGTDKFKRHQQIPASLNPCAWLRMIGLGKGAACIKTYKWLLWKDLESMRFNLGHAFCGSPLILTGLPFSMSDTCSLLLARNSWSAESTEMSQTS